MADPRHLWKLLGSLVLLFVVGLNLRLTLAGFTPLIPLVQAESEASNSSLGLATGVAVVMFGVMALLTPSLVARFGPDRVLSLGLLAICIGTGMRFQWILPGMILIGAGIGLMNVVLPAIVKRDFPYRMALATAVYTSALNVGSAAAATGVVPLSQELGSWRTAAVITGAPALVALAVWLVFRHRAAPHQRQPIQLGSQVWGSGLAWQVTAFMALQSLLYYFVLAWLPTIYIDAGLPAARAGFVLAIAQVGQLVGCIATPLILKHRTDLRATCSVFAGITFCAFLAFLTMPLANPYGFAFLLGIGQGGALVCALLLIGLRSPDARTASSLSGMAQSVGYVVAATGPPLAGLVFDRSGSWDLPLAMMCVLCGVEVVAGLSAGRDRVVPSVLTGRTTAPPDDSPDRPFEQEGSACSRQ